MKRPHHRPIATVACKAAHIDDVEFLRVIDEIQTDVAARNHPTGRRWACWWDICPVYGSVPWKVLLAKARRLERRGLLDGCTCGCRGDFELTAAGMALIA